MDTYSKKSLERLKEKIDIVEVVTSYVDLKLAGSLYKGCCPFHEEKTPSFMIHRGDSHYHCFGCGAHGDGIAFLMDYMKMSFIEAVETLAERFQVLLEKEAWKGEREQGPTKAKLKEALQVAMEFYHFYLLHTDEGQQGLKYLYNRGLDLDFITLFKIGLSPKQGELFTAVMKHHKFHDEVLEKGGLIKTTASGARRPFFVGRITFPILDYSGHPIGFSARKVDEENFGPKYINSPETSLFKKSHTLYGMNFSRRRIAREKRVIIVEGQIDALRLIQEGFDFTVAGQGTAFTQEHTRALLELGVTQIYLAFDGDQAGRQAASKVGDLFQKKGGEVKVVCLPSGSDPDTFLCQEGAVAFTSCLEKGKDYLRFLVDDLRRDVDFSSPAQKNRLVQTLITQIRSWEHPLLVHESLRKLARLTEVPEALIGVKQEEVRRDVFIPRRGSVAQMEIDPDRVLETDLFRWLFFLGSSSPKLIETIRENLCPEHFYITLCRRFFSLYFKEPEGTDFLSLMTGLNNVEERLFFSEIMQKKVNIERAKEGVEETIMKLLERHWMNAREEIKKRIHNGGCSEDELLELAKKFDALNRVAPKIKSVEERVEGEITLAYRKGD